MRFPGNVDTAPAAFLDRDGTLLELVHHLADREQVRVLRGASQAIRDLRSAGFRCVVITNQSVVGRGLLSEEGLHGIHREMERQLTELGAELDAIYFCPLVGQQKDPTVVEYAERKPGPGMLQRAARELQLDLSRSWMIGDSLADVLAGHNAGCRGSVLVRTGHGARSNHTHSAIQHVADDLAAATRWILNRDR